MTRNELTIVRDIDRDDRRWTRRPSDDADHHVRTIATESRPPVLGFRLATLG
jgi:hypothetical protein